MVTSVAMAAVSSWAAEITWTGGGQTDSMADGDNWGGTAPGASDTAIVHANAAKPAIVPAGDTKYTFLVLGGHGSTAQTHAEGVIIQTNGTLTVSGSDGLRIGRLDNCPGTYIISNGTLKATNNSAFVGIHGTTGKLVIAGDGVVQVTTTASNQGLMLASVGPTGLATENKTFGYIEISENGTLDVKGLFNIGNGSGGKGYYGEVRQTGGTVSAGTLYVAAQSTGHKYIQSGGTCTATKARIGPNTNTSGTYELSGGTFSVADEFCVGYNGTGALNISGTGEAVANSTLAVGQGSGKGTVAMDGGKLVANGEVHAGVGNTGTLTVSDGDATFKKHLKLGCASGKTGKIVQTGGAVAMGQNSGNATFPYIGYESGSTGVYEISGGTFATVNTGLMLGNKGTGPFDISGTAVVTIAGNVNLGFETAGKGTLKLRDGGKLIANHVKKHNGTATLVEFDGGTLHARQADDILKNLANVELKAGGLALETARFNLGITNCVFNVTPGGKISVSGGGTVTFKADTSVNLTEKPASAFTFAETDGEFSGMPAFADERGWKMVMAQNRKSIRIVPPGLMVIVK